MERTLDAFERRVLGVLIEKSIATPEYYPMTANAIVAGCNQKNNRDPVMDVDEDVVWKTLTTLREKGIVRQVMPGPGGRTDKYKHECFEHFGWEQRERAVMSELLVRGPQTIGELRTHCSRLMTFDTLESVQIVVDLLMSKDPPFARTLARTSGKAVRYAHTLYPADEDPAAGVTAAHAAPPATHPVSHAATPAPHAAASHAAHTPPAAAESSALHARIQELESRLAELHEHTEDQNRLIDDLTGRLEKLERLMG